MHIALCRANRWSVSPSGAGPWSPASPDPDQQCACGSGEAGVRRPATKRDTVSPSGPRTPDTHAPERDTYQRFAACVAPFLRLELGCACVGVCLSGAAGVRIPAPKGDTDQRFTVQSAMCVWVWRGWINILQIKVEISQNKVKISQKKSRSRKKNQDLANQSQDLAKQNQDLAKQSQDLAKLYSQFFFFTFMSLRRLRRVAWCQKNSYFAHVNKIIRTYMTPRCVWMCGAPSFNVRRNL